MTTISNKRPLERPLEGLDQDWKERITKKHPRFTDPDADLSEHQKKCHHPDQIELKDAISKGEMTAVKKLLDNSPYCGTALVWAASSNNRDMVEMIVNHKKADICEENILTLYFNLRQKHEEFIVEHEKCLAELGKVLKRMDHMIGQ